MRASQARELVRTLQTRTENKILQDIFNLIAGAADVGKEEIKYSLPIPEFVRHELQGLGYKISSTGMITWRE